MKNIFNKILLLLINISIRIYKKLNKERYNARVWSNIEFKKIAHLFTGDIINVSAGTDDDKEQNFYKNYFKNKNSYSVSNYKKSYTNTNHQEYILDLEQKIPTDLKQKFNVVFSHTVLEHIYDIDTAIENLCNLSNDIVITIVPFLQTYHHEEDVYYDFWRFSPLALIRKFNNHNFKTVYINWNKDPIGNIYIFHVASKQSKNWNELIKINEINLKQYAPGFQRQQIQSKLNMKDERVLIKTIKDFINN